MHIYSYMTYGHVNVFFFTCVHVCLHGLYYVLHILFHITTQWIIVAWFYKEKRKPIMNTLDAYIIFIAWYHIHMWSIWVAQYHAYDNTASHNWHQGESQEVLIAGFQKENEKLVKSIKSKENIDNTVKASFFDQQEGMRINLSVYSYLYNSMLCVYLYICI